MSRTNCLARLMPIRLMRVAHVAATALFASAAILTADVACAAPATIDPGATDNDKVYVHTAVQGDSLGKLAARYLVDKRDWSLLQRLNDVSDPDRIPIGKAIRIPVRAMRSEAVASTVTAVRGPVEVDGGIPAVGQTLAERSRLKTGNDGFVTVRLADGSTVTIQSRSSVELSRTRQLPHTGGAVDTVLKLESGRIETQVAKQAAASRYEVRTPTAHMGVRGTVFRVAGDPSGQRGQSEVLEGAVGVGASAGGSAVRLDAGFGTLVEAGRPPLPPVRLLPPPDLAALPSEVRSTAIVVSVAVPGAKAYRLQAAMDRGFTQLLGETVSADGALRLDGMPEGLLHVRARAIDGNGLEGEDAVKTVRLIAQLAAPAVLMPLEGAALPEGRGQFAWQPVSGAAAYRLQIGAQTAGTADFAPPVVDERLTATRFTPSAALPPGRYVWRVAAVGGDDRTGAYSAERRFLAAPTLTLARPETSRGGTTFSWKGLAGATYQFQLSRRESFRDVLIDRRVEGSAITLERLPKDTYFYRVRMVDPANPSLAGPWSPVEAIEVFSGVF